MNRAFFQGRITADPEIRKAGDYDVCDFTLAVSGKKDQPVFVKFTAWGSNARFVEKYFRKGYGMLVYGYYDISSWEDRYSGDMRYKHYFVVDGVEFPIQRPRGSTDAPERQERQERRRRAREGTDDEDYDCPPERSAPPPRQREFYEEDMFDREPPTATARTSTSSPRRAPPPPPPPPDDDDDGDVPF